MKDFSYITNPHPAYIESMYHDFVQNPESVDPEYRRFFEGFDFAMLNGANGSNGNGNGHAATAEAPSISTTEAPAQSVDAGQLSKEFAVYNLIQAYRRKGHLIAKTNP